MADDSGELLVAPVVCVPVGDGFAEDDDAGADRAGLAANESAERGLAEGAPGAPAASGAGSSC